MNKIKMRAHNTGWVVVDYEGRSHYFAGERAYSNALNLVVNLDEMLLKGVYAMSNEATLTWTPETLMKYCHVYVEALEQGREEFVFFDHTFLVSYAKYLIQYLEAEYKKRGLVTMALEAALHAAKQAQKPSVDEIV